MNDLAAARGPTASEEREPHYQYRLRWLAAPRPPVHNDKMEGIHTVNTLDSALRFARSLPEDAEILSFVEIISRSYDKTSELRFLLSEANAAASSGEAS